MSQDGTTAPPPDPVIEAEERRALTEHVTKLHDDFAYFLTHLWIELGKDRTDPLGPVEYDICDFVANCGSPRRGVLAFRFIGKALALDTPIPTPRGWTTMGEIREGDEVFDEKGSVCRVTHATSVALDRPCYRVTFCDKTSVVTDAEHLWSVHDIRAKKTRLLTTEHMSSRVLYRYGTEGRADRSFRVAMAGPINCAEASLPIDPYMLGLWLGDGHSAGARISYHADEEEHLRSEITRAGFVFSPRASMASGLARGAGIGNLHTKLRKAGLLRNKHIPKPYLRASIDQRLALLQGIVDTDGHVDEAGHCEIVTVKPALRDGIMELVRSLGFKSACYTGRATIDGRDCGEKYRIYFWDHKGLPAARLVRKRGNFDNRRTSKRFRSIVSIDPVDSVPVRCIAVDSASRLYLAGEGMVPTHNTTIISAGYSAWRLFRDPDIKILIVSKTKDPGAKGIIRLLRGWFGAVSFLRHLNPKDHGEDFATDQVFQFDVAGSTHSKIPSVMALGIGGQLAGLHTHIVIGDDVETRENTKTVASRLDLDTQVKDFSSVATMGDREIIFVGTFHHEDSLYLKLSKRGYLFRTWPLTYPRPEEKHINLAPMYMRDMAAGKAKVGDIACPDRFGIDFVADQQAEGETYWLMQYQLVCNLSDGRRYPLRLADLIVFPMDREKAPVSISWGTTNDRGGSTVLENIPVVGWEGDRLHAPIMFDATWANYTGTKAFVDPAGKGTDRTGLAIVSHLAGMLWVKGVYGLEGGSSSERLDEIAQLLRTHGVRDCYCETNIDTFNTYFPMLETAIRRLQLEPGDHPAYLGGWHCSLDKRHSSGVKEVRIIECLEPLISSHRMVFHPDTLMPKPSEPRDNELQWQIAAITKDRKCLLEDGKVDALAGCVKEWMDVLRLDPRKASMVAKTRWLEDELDKHYKLTGQQPTGREPSWHRRR